MNRQPAEDQITTFSSNWREIDAIYEQYAKSVDLPYSSLRVLTLIFTSKDEDCTQKEICRQTYLPKQTVNAIVTGFMKGGMVELKEIVSDRRNKAITLTKNGRKFAEKIVVKVNQAERDAWAKMRKDQRVSLLENTRQYKEYLRKGLGMDSVR